MVREDYAPKNKCPSQLGIMQASFPEVFVDTCFNHPFSEVLRVLHHSSSDFRTLK